MKNFHLNIKVKFQTRPTLLQALLELTKFDETLLKSACEKGAVWIEDFKSKKKIRIRDWNLKLNLEDKLFFHFDPKVLSLPELVPPECLLEDKNYGVWFKDVGVVSQGTQFGDHTSLLRYLEKIKKKEVYLVHRLDRETSGLMIFAYNSHAASKFSSLFQNHLIHKEYRAIVKGELPVGESRVIDLNLDGKKAITKFTSLEVHNNQTLLQLTIQTGRLHQIRRHLDQIGYPVMGDPKYGKNNKNKDGLKLLAYSLSFRDPWTDHQIQVNSSKMLNF